MSIVLLLLDEMGADAGFSGFARVGSLKRIDKRLLKYTLLEGAQLLFLFLSYAS